MKNRLENYLSSVHGKAHAIERSALALVYKLTAVRGTPGIHRYKRAAFVLFTYRDTAGSIAGVLTYYFHGFTSPVQGERFPGWCELVVAKSHQRQGIAMQLLSRAHAEVDLKPFEQAYSPEGYLLMCKFLGLPQPSIDALRAMAAKTKFGTLSLDFPSEGDLQGQGETVSQTASMGKSVAWDARPGSPLCG